MECDMFCARFHAPTSHCSTFFSHYTTASSCVKQCEKSGWRYNRRPLACYAFVNGRGNGGRHKELLKHYSGELREFASAGSLKEGRALHGHLVRTEVELDSHLWNSLINLYAKCGSSFRAHRALDRMPEPDVVSWNALITGYIAEGKHEVGITLFCDMCEGGVRPNGFVLATGLKVCSLCMDLTFGEQLHCQAVKLGFLWDLFVGSALVDVYAKCEELELARKMFDCISNPNSVSWTALLNGYVQIGDGREALKLFCSMTESETRLSKFTLAAVVKACTDLEDLKQGQVIHSLSVKTGSESDELLSSSLVGMYSTCELVDEAYKVFKAIDNPDVVAWSIMISGFERCGCFMRSIYHFSEMMKKGVRPNEYILSTLASVAAELEDLRYGESIHAYIRKLSFEADNSVCNSLIMMYMKNGLVQDGHRLFDSLENKDTVSWNALLSGLHYGSSNDEGLRIFRHMLLNNFKPNKYTFISILRSCADHLKIRFGKQVHALMAKSDLQDDTFVTTALIDLYMKCGCLDGALLVFDGLKRKDVYSWTVIISGLINAQLGEKAIKCFRQMQNDSISANECTLSSCLRACSNLTSLRAGQQFHAWVLKSGQLDDCFVSSALIDMYGKCGCLKDSEAVFTDLYQKDIVLWNTIICIYSQYGVSVKVLDALHCLMDEGLSPNQVTFLGVLSACSRMGLVKEGKKYFSSLTEVYGIEPTMDHYACMVDILGRAGRLDEVMKFVNAMPVVPNSLVWQTVLGACRMHGNVELAEAAANKLFELDPTDETTYVLLSNIYAAKERWKDVGRIRKTMTDHGVKKEPGCSWIEVDSRVHVFLPCDRSHPNTTEIYRKLEELHEKLTLSGYVPNMDCVQHNVSDAEKKDSLLCHSERLALAFGLISTKPRSLIRVFKNLRICVDCHSAIKLIADITCREIVVRDVTRFHHFRNGACSCGDYW